MDIQKKIKGLPSSPGVYLFKDENGEIIYIGKARNLKKRVRSYFTRASSGKTTRLVSQIRDLDYISATSEIEAIIKEASLIKENLPKYNVSLRDDKSFPLIKITKEEYPVISVCRNTRRSRNDKASYFGPYTSADMVRQALKAIRELFGFRNCKKLPKKACLYYRLNLCPAPCIGAISCPDYQDITKEIILFLEGKKEELLAKLFRKMQQLSEEKRFEEAAKVRDRIAYLTFAKRQSARSIDYLSEAESMKAVLNLAKAPQRIEAFDISNIFGKEACGSMVSFYKGSPDKDNYRRFRIKTVQRIDDYAMLREVIRRRYERLVKENLKQPDLILIDGGKGHLTTAAGELKNIGLDIPVISIAKEKENIYIPGRDRPVRLPYNSKALHLIQRIRNEAHRFAVSYHRVLRRKRIIGK